ncbi:MAG: ATP phosphoribosyltransferase regulatory subunit [Oscillospiraceae bacterium]|nr:ATP phosphoribosyltransferase regulatory subunit [Oscillospiraceae bacterium]
MEINENLLFASERAELKLRRLYQSRGYSLYRMVKFEPYDLYAENRSFVVGNSILTFTDRRGRLMALKPDVTMSIIKNYRGGREQVYYAESIYREGADGALRELRETGVERLGDVDTATEAEVLALAADSLAVLDSRYILDAASMAYVAALEEAAGIRGELSVALRRALMAKNAAGVRALLRDTAAPDRVRKAWETLAELYAPAERAVLELYELCLSDDMEKAAGELGELSRRAEVNVDFSVISDGRYYNGIVFKGYLPGVPSAVLSGGRYDGLAKRLGKDCGAVGFAVYTEYLNGRESL